jgi:acetolactate synthase I/II/III large subunit
MMSTVSSVLLDILKKHGVKHIIGLPAAQIGLVMNGASRDQYFSYVTTRHEEAAAHMAHAVARVSDGMAVCFGTVGPGATNLIPGVAAAWADNMPMLVVTANNQSNTIHPEKDLLQCADHIAMFKPITKWSACITDPARAPELIERALYLARSGRPGPVHLDIPCDIGAAPCNYDLESTPVMASPRPVPSASQLAEVVDLIAAAKRPLLIAGGGVSRSRGVEALRGFLAETKLPVMTTLMGKGSVEHSYTNHIGSGVFGGPPVFSACAEADLILVFGCKFSTWIPINKPPALPVPSSQKIVQIDIDSLQLGKNVPATIGLIGDARETILCLTEAVKNQTPFTFDESWIKGLREQRESYLDELNTIADGESEVVNTAAIARRVMSLAPEDAIVCIDGGQTMQWAYSFYNPDSPYKLLHNPGMGHLGTGQPFANGAKLARHDQPVILITGDGGLGCTMQEFETAARNGLKTITVVCNDSHWGMYRPFAELFENPELGTQLTDLNFAQAAEAMGCFGRRVETLDELETAIKEAMVANRPSVIDIRTEFTPHPIDEYWPTVVLQGADFPAALAE